MLQCLFQWMYNAPSNTKILRIKTFCLVRCTTRSIVYVICSTLHYRWNCFLSTAIDILLTSLRILEEPLLSTRKTAHRWICHNKLLKFFVDTFQHPYFYINSSVVSCSKCAVGIVSGMELIRYHFFHVYRLVTIKSSSSTNVGYIFRFQFARLNPCIVNETIGTFVPFRNRSSGLTVIIHSAVCWIC